MYAGGHYARPGAKVRRGLTHCTIRPGNKSPDKGPHQQKPGGIITRDDGPTAGKIPREKIAPDKGQPGTVPGLKIR